MTGAVMNPAPVTKPANIPTTSASINSFRISAAVDRLHAHLRNTSTNNDNNNEFGKLCLTLARGIDYAVGNNEIPQRAQELPDLMKQVCRWTNDTTSLAAIMVLMISVKGACRVRWFSEKDNEELHTLSNEIANIFCSIRDMNSGESTFHQSISAVMSRFYPGMKMVEVIAFVEAPPGYGSFVKDFHIALNAKLPDKEVYLFVARADTAETSSCIISPQLVNILLNGRAVDRRTCVCKDPGPQLPTRITDTVKSGNNLLQALGQFNGKYIILVAFMSIVSKPSCQLPDYVTPAAAAASESDNDIIEGPSKISLNCPISYKRIKTPVKGHLCKHFQCFDFDNYVDMNSRRPSWRCPHCSQSVCFTDIRIDQAMVKVLKEARENVSHVKFTADGSWETFNESDDQVNKPQNEAPLHQESPMSMDVGADIMDLTEGDNEMYASNSHQVDKKPSPAQLQDLNMNNARNSVACHMMAPVTDIGINETSQSQSQTLISASDNMKFSTQAIRTSNSVMNANLQGQSQYSASNNVQLPTHAIGTSKAAMNSISQSQNQLFASNNMQTPTHAIGASNNAPDQGQSQSQFAASSSMQLPAIRTSTAALNASMQGQRQNQSESQFIASSNMRLPTHASGTFNTFRNATSGQGQTFVYNDMQFQQHNSNNTSNDYGRRHPTPARHITRIPIAVQALPAEASTETGGSDRQQQFHRYQIDEHQIMHMMSATQSQNMGSQNWAHRDHSHVSSQPAQQFSTDSGSPQLSNGYNFNSYQNHALNQMTMNSVRSPARLSPQVLQGAVGPTYEQGSNQEAHHYTNVAAQQAILNSSWTAPVPAPLQTSGLSMPVTSLEDQRGQVLRALEGSTDAPAIDPNWRPNGRMRGSLVGRAYSDALNQMIIYPTEPVQPVTLPILNTPRPAIPSHLQVLMTNNINAQGSVFDGTSGGSFA